MRRELGHELTPYEEVRQRILECVAPLPSEDVTLAEAWGRVLSGDIVAGESIPPFDSSAMDGFAVRAADLAAATAERPVALPVAATLAAGDGAPAPLPARAAMRIMTGAVVPHAADAVVPHELTRFDRERVEFAAPARAGQNIRRAGGDMRPGDRVLGAGMRLRGPQIAVAATVGHYRLQVTARPRVRILSPGNELVEPWQAPGPGQIRNGNAYGLAAFVREEGALPELGGIVPDSRAAIRAAIRTAAADGADLILTTGGVSAGDFDFVKVVASEEGDPGWVFRTDMRPGKPLVFARLDGVPLIGLPGNPAAAIVSFVVFVRPLLRKLLGAAPVVPATFPVRFPDELRYKGGRVFLLRCRVEPDEASPTGGFRFAGAGDQDSSFLSSLARANALVRLPAERDGVPAGGVFPAQWLHAVE